MKLLGTILFVLLLFVSIPFPLPGQEAPPPGLEGYELARSRSCVPALANLADLNATLEPMARRLERLNALGRAVSLEESGGVTPFNVSDSIEDAVAGWFASDSILAVRYLATSDSSLVQERASERAAILDRINAAIRDQVTAGQEKAREGAPVRAAAQTCEGALFVRSAVLEVCDTTESPVCEAARTAPDSSGSGGFVESADDLWDVEQYRPWTEPLPLQPDQTGSLGGARTSALTRRGNIVFTLTLAPLIQARESLSPEQIQASEANLDSLGFVFDHPSFVMAPGFELAARLPAPLDGTTHYVLHFGDLTGEGDVLYTVAAGSGGPLQVSFPATKAQLDRLQAGEPVSLTALRVPAGEEPEDETTAIFTLTLLQVGQATNSGALLEYMRNGSLNRDLKALIPPGGGG